MYSTPAMTIGRNEAGLYIDLRPSVKRAENKTHWLPTHARQKSSIPNSPVESVLIDEPKI